MKVYFINSSGKEIMIKNVDTEEQGMKAIKDFCSERDYTIKKNIRRWNKGNRTYIDVGSWFEKFAIDWN